MNTHWDENKDGLFRAWDPGQERGEGEGYSLPVICWIVLSWLPWMRVLRPKLPMPF